MSNTDTNKNIKNRIQGFIKKKEYLKSDPKYFIYKVLSV